MTEAKDRYTLYLENQIQNKLEERTHLGGELDGLRSALSSYLTIKADEERKASQ